MAEAKKIWIGDGYMPEGTTRLWILGDDGTVLHADYGGPVEGAFEEAYLLCGGKVINPGRCFAGRDAAFRAAGQSVRFARTWAAKIEAQVRASCEAAGLDFDGATCTAKPKVEEDASHDPHATVVS